MSFLDYSLIILDFFFQTSHRYLFLRGKPLELYFVALELSYFFYSVCFSCLVMQFLLMKKQPISPIFTKWLWERKTFPSETS